jgi:hypothetical protein
MINAIKVNNVRQAPHLRLRPFSHSSLKIQLEIHEEKKFLHESPAEDVFRMKRFENVFSYIQSTNVQTLKWEGVLVGGSMLKQCDDAYSDTDLSIILCENEFNRILASRPFALHTTAGLREETEYPAGNKLDIRYISLPLLKKVWKSFDNKQDCSSAVQDLLFNITEGRYLYQTFALRKILASIEFKPRLSIRN